jgi:hypothetical protein
MAKKEKKAREDEQAQEVEPEAVTIAEAADAATARRRPAWQCR